VTISVVCLDVGEVVIDETRVWSVWADVLEVSPFTMMAAIGAQIARGGQHTDALDAVAGARAWRDLEDEHERRFGGFGVADLYPDAADGLAAIAATGRRVVLAGNQPARRTAQLQALGLPVDDIVTSEELGAEKPMSAFFERILERVGGTALYVGDRVDNDVVPARAAGMMVAWLRRGPWALLQAPPDDVDVTASSLAEVAAWVGAS